jgi:cysteine desulfurase
MAQARTYLDHNATAPLAQAARDAMVAAMDVAGNPSSVHGEGRIAKGLIEKARGQISDAFGAGSADIVFTSGATEAAALALRPSKMHSEMQCSEIEHEAVSSWCKTDLTVDAHGAVTVVDPAQSTLQLANSETGIVQDLPHGMAVVDATQGFGKVPMAFNWLGCDMALISAHKFGGPKGIGALVLKQGLDIDPQILGGGQEMGRRSGTENILGIVGFGAAAEAANKALNDGLWEAVAQKRDHLQALLLDGAPELQVVGAKARRLPNTLSVIASGGIKGWKGETQVMQMDLAGFAVSAGSACSSGKVKSSRVLRAMGYSEDAASCAMRVSLGLETTQDEIERFASRWLLAYDRWKSRAA